MKTAHIICQHCQRGSFSEDPAVVRCPYCDSEEIDTAKVTEQPDRALSLMGFDNLNDEQKAVVLSTEGINYVEAGPGTAKSTTLVFRARYLIHYRQDKIHRPLILTFTNQAVDQLVQAFLNERPRERPVVATLHGFAYGRLFEFRNMLPDAFKDFRLMDENDWNTYFASYRDDVTGLEEMQSGAEVRREIQRIKRATPSYIDFLMRGIEEDDSMLAPVLFYQKTNHLLDFDDLIHAFVWLMLNKPEVRRVVAERYHYVLVDESQDLTEPELQMLNLITFDYRNLFLVGDTDQGIYGWRGAGNNAYDWLLTLCCKVHRFELTRNYRSSQAILDAAEKVIESAPNRTQKKLVAVYPKGVKIMVKECPDPFHEAKIIASSIELATDAQSQPLPLSYADIAVLARNHASLRLIRKALVKKKIPVYMDNETPLFQNPVIQSVIRYLRFLADPNPWTLNSLDEPMIPEELWSEFMEELDASDGSVLKVLNHWNWEEKPLTPLGAALLKMLNDVKDSLYGLKANTLPVTLEFLLSLVKTSKAERELETFRELSRKLLKRSGGNMNVFLDLLALSAMDETESSESKNHVHLLTLHGSKGREFKKVFIAGVNASIIPNPKGSYEEERRLFYVGITRARKELVISYSRTSFGHPEKPSPFLTRLLESPSAIFCPAVEYKKKRKKKA